VNQFLVKIGSGLELHDLAQLDGMLTAWVENVYHGGCTPGSGRPAAGPRGAGEVPADSS
jgi:hypothetical protein